MSVDPRYFTMRSPFVFPLLLLVLTFGSQVIAEDDPAILTLDRIFKEKEFKTEALAGRWRQKADGDAYSKSAEADGKEIWQFQPGEKEASVMVKSSELIPFGTEEPLPIDGYALSKDESLLLIYTNSERVWRRNTRGDYWILDRASGELRQLGGDAPPSSLMFAKLSPTGSHVAYVRDRNIHVEDLSDHSIRTLTTTNTENIINGTSDWVYVNCWAIQRIGQESKNITIGDLGK